MVRETPVAHFYAIELPTPFPVGPVTVYLAGAPGAPLTLVDTGPRTPETRSALEAGLVELGYTPAQLQRLIITHAHVDHFGLAGDLVAASGAHVLTHPWNLPSLHDFQAEQQRRAGFYAQLLRRAAVPEEMMAAVAWATRGMRNFSAPVRVSDTLEEGDRLSLLGRDWVVLHTPGHSAGLICLYDPESKVLLSNDHLLADISSNPVVEPAPPGRAERLRSLVAYQASLRRVAGMDVRIALPSHGPEIEDVAGLVGQRLSFHERRLRRVLDVLGAGPRTTWEVTQALFPDRRPLDTFLAVSEVIGHLDVLEVEGKIAGRERDGAIEWSLIAQYAPGPGSCTL